MNTIGASLLFLLILGTAACSVSQHEDIDDEGATSSDITGTPSDARACVIADAYNAAPLSSFQFIPASALPFSPLPAPPGVTFSYSRFSSSKVVGTVYVAEETRTGALSFYDSFGTRVARASRTPGGGVVFGGPSGTSGSLSCSKPAGPTCEHTGLPSSTSSSSGFPHPSPPPIPCTSGASSSSGGSSSSSGSVIHP